MARPTKYKEEYVKQAGKLCALGATEQDLADFFNCTTVTMWRWRVKYPEFCNAIKTGKGEPDDRVERSLYHRAVGYTHEDVHITSYQGVVTQTVIMKHYPPDSTACLFWLKNRRPDDWREKSEDTTGEYNVDDEFK